MIIHGPGSKASMFGMAFANSREPANSNKQGPTLSHPMRSYRNSIDFHQGPLTPRTSLKGPNKSTYTPFKYQFFPGLLEPFLW